MARAKAFERDTVLGAAASVFATHGYEGTSTDALLEAMGIGRQSLYDTFGDKRQLYLAALEHYSAGSLAEIVRALHAGATPLDGIEAALVRAASLSGDDGCLGVGAICEFGRTDRDVARASDASSRLLHGALVERLEAAKVAGQVDAHLDAADAARFLATVLAGMKVSARGGATGKALRAVAALALRGLR